MTAFHHVVVLAFLAFYAYKVVLLLAGQRAMLDSLRARAPWLDGVLGSAVLLTGGWLAIRYPGAWPMWLVAKLVLVLALLPVSLIAMRRQNRALALLTLAAFGYVYGIGYTRSLTLRPSVYTEPPTTPTDPRHGQLLTDQPAAPAPDTVANGGMMGQLLYRQNCVQCHGINGDKCMYGAHNLQQSDMPLEARMALVSHGRGKMPAFSPKLSGEQVAAVARFSASLYQPDSAQAEARRRAALSK